MQKIDVKIRNVSIEDLTRVVYINRQCLPENYSLSYFISLIRKYADISFVAEVDGTVIGYILCTQEKKGFSFLSTTELKGHVVSVAVLPEYRGLGIGKKLVTESIEIMRENGFKEVYLEVRVSNRIARQLYYKLGFEDTKIMKGYYRDGEDGLVMTLDFQKPRST